MKRVFRKKRILFVSLALDLRGQFIVPLPVSGERPVTEKSLAGFAAALSKALLQGASLTFGNFPFQLGQQWRSTATRREITLDLFVPRLPVTLAQPTR